MPQRNSSSAAISRVAVGSRLEWSTSSLPALPPSATPPCRTAPRARRRCRPGKAARHRPRRTARRGSPRPWRQDRPAAGISPMSDSTPPDDTRPPAGVDTSAGPSGRSRRRQWLADRT
ncbi:hypothetical protein AB691_3218 [Stutzerimonas stutzeri]|nr:hypothetical protein AB691_3218 [Stutzerimonas stutzeri]